MARSRFLVLVLVLVFVLMAGVSGVWPQAAPVEPIGPMQILAILSIERRCPAGAPASAQLNTAALAGAAGLDAFDNGVRADVINCEAFFMPYKPLLSLSVYGVTIYPTHDLTSMMGRGALLRVARAGGSP